NAVALQAISIGTSTTHCLKLLRISEDDGSGPSVGLPRKEESTSVNIRPAACSLDTTCGACVACNFSAMIRFSLQPVVLVTTASQALREVDGGPYSPSMRSLSNARRTCLFVRGRFSATLRAREGALPMAPPQQKADSAQVRWRSR